MSRRIAMSCVWLALSARTFNPNLCCGQQHDIDQLIWQVISDMESADGFCCEFVVRTGIAQDERELASGRFSQVTAEGRGIWGKDNGCEIYDLDVTKVSNEPIVENGRVVGGFIPIKGGEFFLGSREHSLLLNKLIGTGVIDRTEIFDGSPEFNPWRGLNVIGANEHPNPLMLLLAPQLSANLEMTRNGTTARIRATHSVINAEAIVETEPCCFVRSFVIAYPEFRNWIQVFDTLPVRDCYRLPRAVTGVINDTGEFPKRCRRWEIVSIRPSRDSDFQTQTVGRYQVRLQDRDVWSSIPAGTIFGPESLPSIFAAVSNAQVFEPRNHTSIWRFTVVVILIGGLTFVALLVVGRLRSNVS